jgi:hypothetical protein
MKKRDSVINTIQRRFDNELQQLQQFVETYEATVPVLDKKTNEFKEALHELEEWRDRLNNIYLTMSAGVGNLKEGDILLQELYDGSATSVTLLNRLVDVFMQGDYSILVQALTVLDPPLRLGAMKSLDRDTRDDLLDILLQVNAEDDYD